MNESADSAHANLSSLENVGQLSLSCFCCYTSFCVSLCPYVSLALLLLLFPLFIHYCLFFQPSDIFHTASHLFLFIFASSIPHPRVQAVYAYEQRDDRQLAWWSRLGLAALGLTLQIVFFGRAFFAVVSRRWIVFPMFVDISIGTPRVQSPPLCVYLRYCVCRCCFNPACVLFGRWAGGCECCVAAMGHDLRIARTKGGLTCSQADGLARSVAAAT